MKRTGCITRCMKWDKWEKMLHLDKIQDANTNCPKHIKVDSYNEKYWTICIEQDIWNTIHGIQYIEYFA